MKEEVINVSSGSADEAARALSNFPKFPFILNGKKYESVEGKVQGDKFPPGDPRKWQAYNSYGKAAKEIGKKAAIYGYRFIWTNDGRRIEYGSLEHYKESELAIRAKFDQNPEAMKALLSTKGKKIIHEIGPESPNTCLPKEVFCDILTRIRDEKLKESKEN